MNFVGHAALAWWTSEDPGHALGAAAPDLFGAARVRRRAELPSSVERGINHHRAVDDAFHRHPSFVEAQRHVLADLRAGGVGRGAARACAHVGVELLLDGWLLGTGRADGFEQLWRLLGEPGAGVLDLVQPEQAQQWAGWLHRFTHTLEPSRYREPDYCARALEAMLRRRPLLSLPSNQRVAVATSLAREQPHVEARADRLMYDLRSHLQHAPSSPVRPNDRPGEPDSDPGRGV